MARATRRLVVGNWKMHGSRASLRDLDAARDAACRADVDLIVAPPFTLLADATRTTSGMMIAGQDCHARSSGAHTGSISAAMLREIGARAVILGHSERRAGDGDTSEVVAAKVASAAAEDLLPIICVGETWEERARGDHVAAIRHQLSMSVPVGLRGGVIAYEPVWAIGSGRTPTPGEIGQANEVVRSVLAERGGDAGWRVLYGGSVSAANAEALAAIDDLDGFLVGAASLRADDFASIMAAAGKAPDRLSSAQCDDTFINAREASMVGARA